MMPSHGRNRNNPAPRLKSDNSDIMAYATFVNCSERNVKVYWIDFRGERVDYTRERGGLKPRQYLPMNTFEGHPWIFRDRDTNDKLVFKNKHNKLEEVYFPEAWDGREAFIVRIQIPVYSLQELCCQKIRKLVEREHLGYLELPGIVKQQLLHPNDSINVPGGF